MVTPKFARDELVLANQEVLAMMTIGATIEQTSHHTTNSSDTCLLGRRKQGIQIDVQPDTSEPIQVRTFQDRNHYAHYNDGWYQYLAIFIAFYDSNSGWGTDPMYGNVKGIQLKTMMSTLYKLDIKA